MREISRFDAGTQPGGRAPAPGELALVQAFVNTHFDLDEEWGADVLASPAHLTRWLRARTLLAPGARATAAEHERALAVRDALRALLLANNGAPPDPGAADVLHAPVEVRVGATAPVFAAAAPGVEGALGVVLAIVARAQIEGTWSRFKACREHDCHWAFYDHSRNQSGSWCSMRICGGRVKARRYYARRRGD